MGSEVKTTSSPLRPMFSTDGSLASGSDMPLGRVFLVAITLATLLSS